jgi:hypothetical protein
MIELWLVGEMAVKELYFLKEIDYGMVQPKEKIEYPIYFYKHQPREILILDEVVNKIIKDKKIARWIVTTKE